PPLFRRGRFSWDFPVAMKGDEVVEPERVESRKGMLQTSDPPRVPGFFEDRPPIQRISPELPIFAEVVRGDPSQESAAALFIQKEDVTILPDVCAIVRDEHGNVAEQFDSSVMTIVPQSLPLLVEEVLLKSAITHFMGQLSLRLLQGRWLARHDFWRPLKPGALVGFVLQCRKQGVRVEPMSHSGIEGSEFGLLVGARVCLEALESQAQLAVLEVGSRRIRSRPCARQSFGWLDLRLSQQALLRERLQVDQERASRKCRRAIVR